MHDENTHTSGECYGFFGRHDESTKQTYVKNASIDQVPCGCEAHRDAIQRGDFYFSVGYVVLVDSSCGILEQDKFTNYKDVCLFLSRPCGTFTSTVTCLYLFFSTRCVATLVLLVVSSVVKAVFGKSI